MMASHLDKYETHGSHRWAPTIWCSDRGSITLEMVILAPALILMLLLVIAAGRIADAHQAIEAAAHDAARQASIARDPATARTNALSSAQASLARQGLSCPATVSVDTSGFARPIGKPATVRTRVTCTVHLADVATSGIPPVTLTAHFVSPLDPFRGRTEGFTNSGGLPLASAANIQ